MYIANTEMEDAVIPGITDPRWGQILMGTRNPEFTVLATRLAVTRLRREVHDRVKSLAQAAAELHRFFVDNPFTHRDAAAI